VCGRLGLTGLRLRVLPHFNKLEWWTTSRLRVTGLRVFTSTLSVRGVLVL